jgi:hypothetical protein
MIDNVVISKPRSTRQAKSSSWVRVTTSDGKSNTPAVTQLLRMFTFSLEDLQNYDPQSVTLLEIEYVFKIKRQHNVVRLLEESIRVRSPMSAASFLRILQKS